MVFTQVALSASREHFHCLEDQLAQALRDHKGSLIKRTNVLVRSHYRETAQRIFRSKLHILATMKAVEKLRPYELVTIEEMGPVLVANQFISKHQLLCEYVGMLDTLSVS
jgi:hypothetical protein